MIKECHIHIEHLTRVEGHGNIELNIEDGKIRECTWRVVEAPRFFESIVRGRHYGEVARITSRICGICAIAHRLVTVKAIETAYGIEVSEQTKVLRRILKHAENFDSNFLHVAYLAAPDYIDVPSVIPLADSNRNLFSLVLELKKLAGDWGNCIGGRTIHPLRVIPGGFSMLPDHSELAALKDLLEQGLSRLDTIKEFLLGVKSRIPAFERETEYISLHENRQYSLYHGDIACYQPDASVQVIPVTGYETVTNEYVHPNSTAKYTKHNRESYMVGALARLHNNREALHTRAEEVLEEFDFTLPCFNPFMNTIAQFIEIYHNFYESIDLVQQLLTKGIKTEKLPELKKPVQRGIAAVEAPRGLLIHEYTFNDPGMCMTANCVIPTNQNHANIQYDFEKIVPEMMAAGYSEEKIKKHLAMLVRAYDPCISCSTH